MTATASTLAANDTVPLTGGEAIVEILRLADAGPMFGMGGFQLLPFYDAVRRAGLTHHLINDERCGAFAADAWARPMVTARPFPSAEALHGTARALWPSLLEADWLVAFEAHPKIGDIKSLKAKLNQPSRKMGGRRRGRDWRPWRRRPQSPTSGRRIKGRGNFRSRARR